MFDFEQENAATMKALTLLQGHMGTILEDLQTQRDNDVAVNKVDATMVTSTADTTLVVMDPIDSIVPLAAVSQPLSHTDPNRLVAAYPWGMPHTYNPQFATRNSFMSYYSSVAAPANVNSTSFPWGMHNMYSVQGVKTEETLVVDIAEDQEPEYIGPSFNFHISATPVQPNPYASAAMVLSFPNNVSL